MGVSVVPETVKLTGTTRCASPEDQDVLERRIGEICAGVGAATGAEIMVEYRCVYPPLLNHEAQTDAAVAIAREFFGDEAVCDNMPGAMGAGRLQLLPPEGAGLLPARGASRRPTHLEPARAHVRLTTTGR